MGEAKRRRELGLGPREKTPPPRFTPLLLPSGLVDALAELGGGVLSPAQIATQILAQVVQTYRRETALPGTVQVQRFGEGTE